MHSRMLSTILCQSLAKSSFQRLLNIDALLINHDLHLSYLLAHNPPSETTNSVSPSSPLRPYYSAPNSYNNKPLPIPFLEHRSYPASLFIKLYIQLRHPPSTSTTSIPITIPQPETQHPPYITTNTLDYPHDSSLASDDSRPKQKRRLKR